MQVILLERVDKLGMMGQVVEVKPGFARNFLLPQKKALRATRENLKQFEVQRAELEATNLKAKQDAEFVAKKLEGLSLILIRQAGESGQLYGSVSARDVADAIHTQASISVSRGQIQITSPIKVLGIYKVNVVLHPEVHMPLSLNVAQSVEEARLKAEKENKAAKEDKPFLAKLEADSDNLAS